MGIFELHGKRYKVVERMFMDAEYSFSMLKFYHNEMTSLLRGRADDFHKYTDKLVEEHTKRGQSFDKGRWLKHFDVYAEYYPQIFNNSFIVAACAQFEFHIKKICALVKVEHKVPLEWDDIEGSVPTRAKRFLHLGGIQLKNDPSDSIQNWLSSNMPGEKRKKVSQLWHELDDLFAVRNCIAHHNGHIQKMRYPERITSFALRKGILENRNGQNELSLNQDFNKEVCDTMMKFFAKLTSAYYGAPLPQ